MAQAVAKVARRINQTMEEGTDSLDLSDCDLVSFPDGVFKMLRSCTENIHKITLANNQLKALGNKFFLTFSQLRDLDLEGNVLTALPEAVSRMEHLVSINLSKNRLAVFPEHLTDVKSLQHISVEGNQITENTRKFTYAQNENDVNEVKSCEVCVWTDKAHHLTAELPMEKLSLMSSLKSLDVRSNPLTTNTEPSTHHFTLLT